MIPVAYNIRNLAVRRATTVATATGLGLVVFVFSSVLMLANGIEHTLGRSARSDVAIVLRKASDAELSSGVEDQQVGVILASQEVAKAPNGTPMGVGEIVVVATMAKNGTDGVANVSLRGVPDNVLEFRPSVKVVEGRMLAPGSDEVVVGKSIRGRFKGLSVGETFELRKNRPMKVVGVIGDGASSYESEVWADLHSLRAAWGREGMVSSVRAKLIAPSKFESFKASIEQDPKLGLEVSRESDFDDKQSQGTKAFILGLGVTIAVFFSIGAMIGAMITMHASVANRQREIGTLRALGFSRFAILWSFLFESLVLAVIGGVLGSVASLGMSFVRFSTMNFATWSEIVFTFEPTLGILGRSIGLAAAMGLAGGLFPAVRAARMSIIEAMRG